DINRLEIKLTKAKDAEILGLVINIFFCQIKNPRVGICLHTNISNPFCQGFLGVFNIWSG
ncbi:MAG: hypothetical protein ABII95_01275, partial [Patescibacteria group bacterium]